MAQSLLPIQLQRSRWRPTAAERREMRRQKFHWQRVRAAESWYARQLRKVAQVIADFIKSFVEPDPEHPDEPGIIPPSRVPEVVQVAEDYSHTLDNWARAAANRMLADVARRDAAAWFKRSAVIGRSLREIQATPLGEKIRSIQEDQVKLIKSIPREAAQRVQTTTQEYVIGGKRYAELADDIAKTEHVTKSRATLIARTETAKAQSAVVQARAEAVHVEQYTWRTMRDALVRPEHRELEGTVHSWNDPPVAEKNGEKHHPGNFPNCRCYAEPLIEDLPE